MKFDRNSEVSSPKATVPAKKIGMFLGWRDPAFGAYKAATHFGVSLIGCFSRMGYCKNSELWDNRALDGYIFVGPDEEMLKVAETLYSEGKAVSVVLRESQNVPQVTADVKGIVDNVVDYLVSLGHREIAMITGTSNAQGKLRLDAYENALRRNGIEPKDERVLDLKTFFSPNPAETNREVSAFFEKRTSFTAVIFGARWVILPVLNAASDCGLSIPEDFAAYIIDDPCDFPGVKEKFSHALLPSYELGWNSVKSVVEQLDPNKPDPINEILPCRMVIRKSCGGRQTGGIMPELVGGESPREVLLSSLLSLLPEYFHEFALETPGTVADIFSRSEGVADELFKLLVNIENHGVQFDSIPEICIQIRDLANTLPFVDSRVAHEIVDGALIRFSQHLLDFHQPKHFEFPGLVRVKRFFPKELDDDNTLRESIEELSRQLSDLTASKFLLMLEPLGLSEDRAYRWDRPGVRALRSEVSVLPNRKLYPLTEFIENEELSHALYLDFSFNGSGANWIYFEIDGEKCYQCIELLYQFAAGYQVFRSYDKQLRNSRSLELAKLSAEHSSELAEEALRVAEKANEAKAKFLSGISHDIRAPINRIIGLTELFAEPGINEMHQQYIEVVQKSAYSLMAIVDEILNFSYIESGQLRIENFEFSIRELFSSVEKSVSNHAFSKGLELSLEIQDGVPGYSKGDPNRLRQVLLNLIGNAIKFTRKGRVCMIVSLLKERDEHVELRFSVSDTGVGIAAGNVSNVFDTFVQGDGSSTRLYGGAGLGLATCKRLLEKMNSEIVVESQKGRGSVFSFDVCLEKSHRGE